MPSTNNTARSEVGEKTLNVVAEVARNKLLSSNDGRKKNGKHLLVYSKFSDEQGKMSYSVDSNGMVRVYIYQGVMNMMGWDENTLIDAAVVKRGYGRSLEYHLIFFVDEEEGINLEKQKTPLVSRSSKSDEYRYLLSTDMLPGARSGKPGAAAPLTYRKVRKNELAVRVPKWTYAGMEELYQDIEEVYVNDSVRKGKYKKEVKRS